jgi:riboflavin synthase
MFTGIIEETGMVKSIRHDTNFATLIVRANHVVRGLKIGHSVCVSGVCLTVVRIRGKLLSFDMMQETLKATSLGTLRIGDRVNLERSLRADSRFDGHFVTGHVDRVETIKEIVHKKNYVEFQISMTPRNIKPYMVKKGSVCVDGVSLTVGEAMAPATVSPEELKGRVSALLSASS